jgi:hypothetical protein
MYAELIHRPAGPFDTPRLEPQELDGYLTEIALNPVFGSRPIVDRVFADLRAELSRAAEESPGLPGRSAYFKLQDQDRDLARALATAGRVDAEQLAHAVILGAGPFAPEGFGTGDVRLRLIPPPLVAEAARLLQGLDPEQFGDWEEEFPEFRQVFAAAAEHGEAIIVA